VVVLDTSYQLQATTDALNVDVAGSLLSVKQQLKSLGTVLDNQLRFNEHAASVAYACAFYTRLHYVTFALFAPQTSQRLSPAVW
jgi:hypothetical protein